MVEPIFAFGSLGTQELLIIAVLLLVFFGGAKLPELMRGVGRGIREFKDAVDVHENPSTDSSTSLNKNNEKGVPFDAGGNRTP